MKRNTILIAAAALAATAALAHEGVENPDVKARMAAMKVIGANTKTIGDMAKGVAPFDAAAARAAAAAIAGEAGKIPMLFEAPAQDPQSEALPVIWTSFPEFTKRAMTLRAAADRASTEIRSPDDLRAALGEIGQACGSCHKSFRE